MVAIKRFNETTAQRSERIIRDYRECLGYLNKLFSLVVEEYCGPCFRGETTEEENACCHVGCVDYDVFMDSPAYEDISILLEVMVENVKLNDGKIDEKVCEYFEANKECCLIDMKSPRCASFYCNTNEINERYGIEYKMEDIENFLKSILLDCERIDVNAFKDYLEDMVNTVKKVKGIPIKDSSGEGALVAA